jgi:hypothetical protein
MSQGSSSAKSSAALLTDTKPAAFRDGASRFMAFAINPMEKERRLNVMLSSPASRRAQEKYKQRRL